MAVVLVIDSYQGFRETMEYCLPKFGHVAITAADAGSGLKLAAARKVDLALVDIEYPRFCGLSTCVALRRDVRSARVPIVLMLDRVTPEWTARMPAIGVDALLPKPFEWREFLSVLARLAPGAVREAAGC